MNLSFALPSPWGPAAAAGLSGLFDLFGSGDTNAIAEIVQAAVNELESYMTQLRLTGALGDATAFFNWYVLNVRDAGGDSLTARDLEHIETYLLPELEKANSYVHGSLAANLATYASTTFIHPDPPAPGQGTERSADLALTVLMMTLTALIAALKLKIRLRSALASYYAPDPVTGMCVSSDADTRFQDCTYEWQWAVSQLGHIIGTPDRLEKVTNPPSGYLRDALLEADAIVDFLKTNSAESRKTVIRLAHGIPGDPPYVINAGNVGWLMFLSRPAYGDFDLNSMAAQIGWAPAMRLLLQRRMVAWANIGVAPQFMGGSGFDVEKVLNRLGSFPDLGSATEAWLNFTRPDLAPHVVAPDDQPSYAADLATAKGWQDGFQKLIQQMPLPAPTNSLTIAAWATDAPPSKSQWRTARRVQYAFSYLNPNGPSLRSDWSAPFDVSQRWKPALHHIEPSPASSGRIQIWRQFVFNDEHGDPQALGIPKIVATLPGTTTQHIDTDPALVATAPAGA